MENNHRVINHNLLANLNFSKLNSLQRNSSMEFNWNFSTFEKTFPGT